MFQFESAQDSVFIAREDLLIDIVDTLSQRLRGRVRDVRLIRMADELVQCGRTNMYYTRQFAQTIAIELAEQVVLVNEIVVL